MVEKFVNVVDLIAPFFGYLASEWNRFDYVHLESSENNFAQHSGKQTNRPGAKNNNNISGFQMRVLTGYISDTRRFHARRCPPAFFAFRHFGHVVGKHGRDVNDIAEKSVFFRSKQQSMAALIKVASSALIAVMADYNRFKGDVSAGLNVRDVRADLKNFSDSLVANDPASSGDFSRSRTPDIARIRFRGHEMYIRTANARVNHFYSYFVRAECR